MVNVPILSGNAGELSPLIDPRSDIRKYSSGCRTLQNMIPRIYGCVERRPGTKFIASSKNADEVVKMIDFQYSDTIAYEIEVGPEYFRFYYNSALLVGSTTTPADWDNDSVAYKIGEFVTSGASVVYRCLVAHISTDGGEHGDPVANFTDWVVAHLSNSYPICETPTPYQAADLFELQFHQSADVVWITHNKYATRKLTRTSVNTFDLSLINFTDGPFLKRNDLAFDNDITLTPSALLKNFVNFAASTNSGNAVETLASGTASGTVANTNDGDTTTYRKRAGHNTSRPAWDYYTAVSHFTITIEFDVTVTRLDEVNYWLGWYTNGTATRTVSVSIKQGGVWTEIGTSAHNKVSILGPWTDVTHIKISLHHETAWVGADAYADCILYELEAWGTQNVLLPYKEVTLVASAPVFDSSHAIPPGALFKLTQPRTTFKSSGSLEAEGIIAKPIDVKGAFKWNSHGSWTGTIELQRNENNEGWETYRTFLSSNDRNVNSQAFVEESDNVQYRVNVTDWGIGIIKSDITVDESTQSGICRVIRYTSSTQVTVEITTDFASTDATLRWAEGAWSAYRGYPAAFTFFEERAVYGGSVHQPQTVWLSESGDFDNFEEGTKDGDSFWRTLSSDKRNGIRWMSALDALAVGTRGGEWRIRATAIDDELTPTNFNARQQTSHGSAQIQPVQIGSVVLFIDFVGRKIREMTFSDAKQKFISPDLTALAEHITLTGITCIAHQKNPDDIVWCTLDDGSLLSMTYERDQDVVAWAKHLIGGAEGVVVESVSVIPSDDEDEVWISVARTIDGSTVRTIEQLQPRVDVDLDDSWFVDSGLQYEGDSAAITGASQADTCVITAVGHGFSNGDQVYLSGIEGMEELNGRYFTIANVTDDTFEIQIFEETSASPS